MVGFPLLLIPLAIYNIVAWLMPGVPLTDPLVRLTLMSGVEWHITFSDILLALGVLLLLLEIFKGARPGSKYLTDHLLSLIVFGGSAAEFVMLPKFGTSTFFLLSLMSMVDFLGGIALRARRSAAPATVSRRAARETARDVEPSEPEPALEHAPPAPASPVAASAPQDHHTPKSTPPAAEQEPAIPSPELQPGSSSASPEAPQR
jgi:hypothetical protein